MPKYECKDCGAVWYVWGVKCIELLKIKDGVY